MISNFRADKAVVIFVFIFALAITAFAGWGVEVGRATETDVFELLADQTAIRMAMSRIQRINANDLTKERQMQLLDVEPGTVMAVAQLMERSEKWWKDEIDGPMERIAKNPAASCEEAQQMISLKASRSRQRQLIGFVDDTMGDILTGKIGKAVQKRCREEKLDECNSTGRYEQIIQWVIGNERQSGLLGSVGNIDDGWGIEALKECANYELHYVSTTDIDDAFDLTSIIDGRIPIKFKPGDGPGFLAQLEGAIFDGEIGSGANPFLQKIICAGEGVTVTCSPGGDPKRPAYAKILNLGMKHKEYYLDEKEVLKMRIVGDDKLELKFSPAMLSSTALIKSDVAPTSQLPFLEVGATGFHIAHKKNRVEEGKVLFNETKRGGYPVLFEFTEADIDVEDDIKASDTTIFELIHKPKKKPFEREQSAPRKPLKPKP